jgi:hypothetical protein
MGLSISGFEMKNGVVSIRERVTVSSDGRELTQAYPMIEKDREVASGVPVFQKRAED